MQIQFKIPEFYSHYYRLTHSVKSYDVYDLNTNIINSLSLLTDVLRIENFRGYSKGKGFNKYLRLRTTTNWAKSEKVTGLRPTIKQNVFFGDRMFNDKRSLLVFVFNDNQLKIDVYRSFYPCTPTILNRIIEQY